MTTDRNDPYPPECQRARETVQERLDGTLEETSLRILEDHLEGCAVCREYAGEMNEVHRALASLPTLRFPEEALGEVWNRTVDSGRRSRPRRKLAFGWRPALAAAATVLVLLLAGWFGLNRTVEQPDDLYTDADLAQAAEEARYVLELTGTALRRTEKAAVEGVLAGQVSPALERIVIDWPEAPDASKRRNGV